MGVVNMSEVFCPTNPRHTLKSTDNDDRFEELTCVSCGKILYKPNETSQPVIQHDTYDIMPETYTIASDWQEDIVDDDELFNLMCSESILHYQLQR
jgi:hypothetical protein